jgi:integrase
MAKSRGFGSVRKLPSGRWQARYTGADGLVHTAPRTFASEANAKTYLKVQDADIERGTWKPQTRQAAVPTLASYAEPWLEARDLKPRTRVLYQGLLDGLLLPTFGAVQLDQITRSDVRTWHGRMTTGPTRRAHAYSLLRTILNTAVDDELILTNPCRVHGAGASKRVKKIEPATLEELEALTVAMPERLRLIVLLGAWCACRFGELVELRRKDLDLKNGVIRVRRAVVWVDGQPIVGTPKSDAGTRDVAIPPHLVPVIAQHLLEHAGRGRDGLVFPASDGHSPLTHDMLKRPYSRAREAAGRPDLRFHDLRHTGAVLAAQSGATLAELMGRLGHSTPGAALRYQHAAAGRDTEIAARLSKLAETHGVS